LFVNGYGPNKAWTVVERPAPTAANPQPALVTIDSVSTGWAGTGGSALAVDAAGNVFAGGLLETSSRGDYWTIRKGSFNASTGGWTFSTVDQFKYGDNYGPTGLAVVNSGPSAGVYAVGDSGTSPKSWMVRKSANGGSTWATVDTYKYDSSGGNAFARGIAGDSLGNVYVVGMAQQGVITGYTKNKTPIYSYSNHWIVRKSVNGGASWTRDDDYVHGEATAVCCDPAGTVYVAGESADGDAIVRTNAGGSWSTVDDYATGSPDWSAYYSAIVTDPSGNHYAGGSSDYDNGWLIRSDAASIGAAPASAMSASTFSSIPIGSSTSTTHDSLFGVISPSTDMLA
jgi:hypothetical protein